MSLFKKRVHFPNRTMEQLKSSVNILFIDNEYFNLTTELKEKEGWRHLTCVSDISSLSQPELVDAHIICTDIQGVGKELGFTDEGLGLIEAIHSHYPEKKIIMYSSEAQGRIDAFHPAEGYVNARLRKSANRYQFETQIERLAQEAFCLDACAINIQRVLNRELGTDMSIEEIKKGIDKLYSKGKADSRSICNVYGLDTAGSLASIISLLISL